MTVLGNLSPPRASAAPEGLLVFRAADEGAMGRQDERLKLMLHWGNIIVYNKNIVIRERKVVSANKRGLRQLLGTI